MKGKVKQGVELGIAEEIARKLVKRYGANVDKVFNLYETRKLEADEEGIDAVVFAELCYGLEYELVYKPTDFFIRRTGALFFDIDWVREHKESVMLYMRKQLSFKAERNINFVHELERLLKEAVEPAE